MNFAEQKNLIYRFIRKWDGKGNEDADTFNYWYDLLKCLGVNNPTDILNGQKQVKVKVNDRFRSS